MSDSLQPHELQHSRPPCPSPTPGVHWDSRPSSQWCHPAPQFVVICYSSPRTIIKCSCSVPSKEIIWCILLLHGKPLKKTVQFSHSVVSDSLQLHESQHARPPCPSLSPGVQWNPCPSSWWCHPTILSSVITFSSCPQSLPASESFPMSQLFDAESS